MILEKYILTTYLDENSNIKYHNSKFKDYKIIN